MNFITSELNFYKEIEMSSYSDSTRVGMKRKEPELAEQKSNEMGIKVLRETQPKGYPTPPAKKIKLDHQNSFVTPRKPIAHNPMISNPKRVAPPPSPRKATPSIANSPFLKLINQASSGHITINNKSVSLKPFSDQGTYMKVFVITSSDEVVPGELNEQLVVKVYRVKHAQQTPPSWLLKFMQHSLQNYTEAKENGLKVATIVNEGSAIADHFFIQQKIPYAIDVLDPKQMEQVRQFFLIALEKGINLDLNPGNLLLNEKGEVVLIDFLEESEDQKIIIRMGLKLWHKQFERISNDTKLVEQLFATLTKDFHKYGIQQSDVL